MSHNPPFKSEQKVFTPGGANIELKDFVPLVAPDGGRVVIDALILVVLGTITVATALWDGRDVWRLFSLIQMTKRDGRQRWTLSGYKSRIASIKYNGIRRHFEHANVAIGAAQNVELRALIPFKKPFLADPRAYSMPADTFQSVIVTPAALANAQTGSSVLSAASLNFYVLAMWHSERAHVEFKIDDLVKSVDYTSNTQVRTVLQGVLHDADACKEDSTAGGAQTLNTVTDARIEDLGFPLLTYNDLLDDYTRKRELEPVLNGATPRNEQFLDPWRSNSAMALMTSDDQTAPHDGRLIDSIKIDHSTGLAGMSLITREVVNKSQAEVAATLARFQIPQASIQLKDFNGNTKPLGASSSPRQRATGLWAAPFAKKP